MASATREPPGSSTMPGRSTPPSTSTTTVPGGALLGAADAEPNGSNGATVGSAGRTGPRASHTPRPMTANAAARVPMATRSSRVMSASRAGGEGAGRGPVRGSAPGHSTPGPGSRRRSLGGGSLQTDYHRLTDATGRRAALGQPPGVTRFALLPG